MYDLISVRFKVNLLQLQFSDFEDDSCHYGYNHYKGRYTRSYSSV